MARPETVLVVEDEADLSELIRFNLSKEGYECRVAFDGKAAVAEIARRRPDLIVLDRMLPKMSGDEVIARLRSEPSTAGIPVVMLTAKAAESDELVGFALGADDYITKPFSMSLLIARVRAIFRRGDRLAAEETAAVGPARIDEARHEVWADDRKIALTGMEFRLLQALIRANGRVLSREQLIDTVLGPMVAVTDRTVDVHIAALRKKLGAASAWVQTIRGVGYSYRSPIEDG